MPKQYNYTEKTGRPSKYDPSFIQVVDEYLKTTGREQTKLPKRVDVALILDVDEDTLNNWAKENPDFLGALTRVDMLQRSVLQDDGFYGGKEVNPRMAQFLLSANHNMREKSDVTTDGNALPVPIYGGKSTD
jgi:hypothetical protein